MVEVARNGPRVFTAEDRDERIRKLRELLAAIDRASVTLHGSFRAFGCEEAVQSARASAQDTARSLKRVLDALEKSASAS